ncbi:PQQ-binding-like beta-propeller repeat protein [Rubritalea tangerina]|uniref:PQQ-binding-like beta-propeller repeat protein n=1 Tax=Rubritalea tangerina TaxID=430798 RepID=A0ABW4ZAA3_9BACT
MKTLFYLTLLSSPLIAAEWPTHLHDNLRSGVSSEQLTPSTLAQSWVYTPNAKPQPAYKGKMARDSYAKRTFQSDSFDYDKAFNLIAADNKVFFASSSENACVALDASSGVEVWRLPTGGAVRIAPTYDSAKVYFGSDDGLAYCVNANDGSLVWTYRGGPSATMITSDHKFLTRFPCRSGVIVQDGFAYCGFGLMTWHGNYIAKINATTGALENSTLRSGSNYSFEGLMAADSSNIYVSQGKNTPASFTLNNLSYNGTFPGCGGTYLTLTTTGKLYHGPGHNRDNRTDHMTQTTASSRGDKVLIDYLERIITHNGSEYKIIRDSVSATGSNSWTQGIEKPRTIILGGSTLYVGARKQVFAINTSDGSVQKILSVEGDAYSLALADGKLFASTTTGKIYCFESP